MSHRRVQGLRWARALAKRPACIPQGRPRGVKALGVNYERAVAAQVLAACPSAIHGQWWEFSDSNGHGYCQTDIIVPLRQLVLVLECKYTWVEQGRRQLEDLYLPVVGFALAQRCLGVEVCKVLTSETVGTIIPQLALAPGVSRPVWHNLAISRVAKKESIFSLLSRTASPSKQGAIA